MAKTRRCFGCLIQTIRGKAAKHLYGSKEKGKKKKELNLQQNPPTDLPSVSGVCPSASALEKRAMRASGFAGAAAGIWYHCILLPKSIENFYHFPMDPRKADSCCYQWVNVVKPRRSFLPNHCISKNPRLAISNLLPSSQRCLQTCLGK